MLIRRHRGMGDAASGFPQGYTGTTPWFPSVPPGYKMTSAGDLWYQGLADEKFALGQPATVAYGANGDFRFVTLGPGTYKCNEYLVPDGAAVAPGVVKTCSFFMQGVDSTRGGMPTNGNGGASLSALIDPSAVTKSSLNNTMLPPAPPPALLGPPLTQPPPVLSAPPPPAATNPPANNYVPVNTQPAPAPPTISQLFGGVDLSFLTDTNWTAGLLPNWALIAGLGAAFFMFKR